MDKRTPFEALEACILKAGSQSGMARDLGVTPPAVWKMMQVGRMSIDYAIEAERLYGIPVHELRPDIYPRHRMVDQGQHQRFYGLDRAA